MSWGLLLASSVALVAARVEAEPKRWTTVAGKSRVSFDATFSLGDFAGQCEEVTGEFVADPADLRQSITGALRVNASALRTGIDGRDRDMWRALEIGRYPEIRFTIERVESSFPSVTDRSDVLLTVGGVMQIRGVERPLVFSARVRLQGERLWVRGESSLAMTEFGITPPKRLMVQVGDRVGVSFDLLLAGKD